MDEKMVIHIGKVERVHFYCTRTFKGLGGENLPPDTVLSLTQKEDESIDEFEERARQTARQRGINFVQQLD